MVRRCQNNKQCNVMHTFLLYCLQRYQLQALRVAQVLEGMYHLAIAALFHFKSSSYTIELDHNLKAFNAELLIAILKRGQCLLYFEMLMFKVKCVVPYESVTAYF